MRIVFMGTPAFAATILDYLVSQHEVVGVFTRPDAVRGRGKKLVASPVKEIARKHILPVYEYSSFKQGEPKELLKELNPDVICVAAYGAILPSEVLSIPKYGCINVHASLLPRWRGAAPIERAILAGDEEAGVCVMRMEEGLDTGDYCISRSLEIGELDSEHLTAELAELGASALLVALSQIEQGVDSWTKQNEEHVTYAHKIEKGELNIAPGHTAQEALRKVRASSVSHPSRCAIAGKSITLVRADLFNDKEQLSLSLEEGRVAFVAKRLFLGFSEGILEILELKPDGKSTMDARSFAAGIQGIKKYGADWRAYNA